MEIRVSPISQKYFLIKLPEEMFKGLVLSLEIGDSLNLVITSICEFSTNIRRYTDF